MKKNLLTFSVLMISVCFLSAKTFSQEAPGEWADGHHPVEPDLPSQFKLTNYPNPVITNTTVQYEIPADSKVSLQLYNTYGQLINTIYTGYNNAGTYETELNASGITGGIYVCTLSITSGGTTSHLIRKIKIVK